MKLIIQLLGLIYAFAFLSFYVQYRGLIGSNGILPVRDRINDENSKQSDFISVIHSVWRYGSLLEVSVPLRLPVDIFLELILWVGMISSALLTSGMITLLQPVFIFISWMVYLTIIHSGQTFLSFQWDILLCEFGFLSFLITCFFDYNKFKSTLWPIRFLAWKLMYLAGVVKLQSKCPTWENLTALEYHFASQCIPNPISWYGHQLPPILLKIAVAGTLLIEIPWTAMLLAPITNVRRVGVILQVILQLSIMLTGNYNFFNILTITLMMSAWYNDCSSVRNFKGLSLFGSILFMIVTASLMVNLQMDEVAPWWIGKGIVWSYKWDHLKNQTTLFSAVGMISTIAFFTASYVLDIVEQVKRNCNDSLFSTVTRGLKLCWSSVGAVMIVVWILLSASHLQSVSHINQFIPPIIHNIHESTNQFFLTSSYGLFRRMTGVGKDFELTRYPGVKFSKVARPEIILEGYDDRENIWKRIDFLYKPNGPKSPPQFIAPHQPRLDWQMWFAALGSYQHNPWLIHLLYKLLNPNQPVEVNGTTTMTVPRELLSLLIADTYPFKMYPPQLIKATIYDYDMTRLNISELVDRIFHRNVESTPTREWWIESNPREYLPPLEAKNPSLLEFLKAHGVKTGRRYVSPEKLYQDCVSKKLFTGEPFSNLTRSLYDIGNRIHHISCKVILVNIDYSNCWNSAYFQTFFAIVFTIQGIKVGYRLLFRR